MSSPNKTTAQLVSDLATAVVQSKDYTDKQPRAIGFDEIIPKKARLDVTMTPSLERSKVAGSPHNAVYWAERVYQACRSGLYRNPKEAYAGIIRQAEKTGLSENQRGELLRFLGAAGIDVGDKEQDNLNEPYKMTATEKREAAQEDVTARVLASVRNHLGQEHALTHLGKIIAESKRAASFTQRKAVRVNNDRNINDIRGYAKAASVAAGDVESVFRVASAMLSGARLASEPSPRIKKAAGLVVRCMSAGRNLLKQGFSHQEVAKHIAQMPLSSTPLAPVEQQIKTQPGIKQTVKTDDKGKPAIVVQQDSTPPIKTASKHEGTEQYPFGEGIEDNFDNFEGYEKDLDGNPNTKPIGPSQVDGVVMAWKAGKPSKNYRSKGYPKMTGGAPAGSSISTDGQHLWSFDHLIGHTDENGKKIAYECNHTNTTRSHAMTADNVADESVPCPTCEDQPRRAPLHQRRIEARQGTPDEQRLASAASRVWGMAEGDESAPGAVPEAPGASREAMLDALDQIHQAGEVTLGAREVVAQMVDSGEVQDLESLRAELARKMSE